MTSTGTPLRRSARPGWYGNGCPTRARAGPSVLASCTAPSASASHSRGLPSDEDWTGTCRLTRTLAPGILSLARVSMSFRLAARAVESDPRGRWFLTWWCKFPAVSASTPRVPIERPPTAHRRRCAVRRCGAVSEFGQLGARQPDPHAARTEVHSQGGVRLDAYDPAEAVGIVDHLILHCELFSRRSSRWRTEGTGGQEAPGRSAGWLHHYQYDASGAVRAAGLARILETPPAASAHAVLAGRDGGDHQVTGRSGWVSYS